MDDAIERLRDFPQFFDAKRVDLRVRARDVEGRHRGFAQLALRALGEHRHLGQHLSRGSRTGLLHAFFVETLDASANTDDATVFDEQLLGIRLGQHVRTECLGLLGEPLVESRERQRMVAVVLKLGRRRQLDVPLLAGQEVHRLLVDRTVGRKVLVLEVWEQIAQRLQVDHRAAQRVAANGLALLDDDNRHLAELLERLGIVGQQLT